MKRMLTMAIVLLTILVNSINYGNYKNVKAEQTGEQNTITVLVNLDGGNVNGNTEYAIIGKPGETVVLMKPVYEGCILLGYSCSNGKIVVDDNDNYVYTFGNTNTTIKALWVKENDVPTQTPEQTREPISTTPHAIATMVVPTDASNRNTPTPFITAEPVVTNTIKPTNIPEGTSTPEPTKEPAFIKNAEVKLEKNTYYTKYAKKVQPGIKVKYNQHNLKINQDYKLSYKNNNIYGKAKVIITGIGDYAGTVTKYFYILPEKTKITKSQILVKNKNKVVKITWKKLKGVGGYQILYSKAKKGPYKEISQKSAQQTSAVFGTSCKILFMKIKPYVIIDGKYKFGPSSPVKIIKIK